MPAGRIVAELTPPHNKERHIIVDGVIVKMEFLHPPESDQNKNHVILLLVISKNGRSKLICYEWDCSTRLITATLKGPGQGLHEDEQVPQLLVPLKKSTAFMLVSEKRMTVYKDILTGLAKSHVLILSNQEPPQEPGSSKRLPLWAQWARPMRNKAHTRLEDNIYLCREDGVVHFLEIKDKVGNMLDTTHRAGLLGDNINTAFAAIDMGFKGDIGNDAGPAHSVDMLIGAGDMNDGGRWSFGAREVAHKIDIIPNWTPLLDLTATDGAETFRGKLGAAEQVSGSAQDQTRFFASTGRDPKHGRITEIRYGIEAIRKGHLSELQEPAQITITQIWVLNEADGGLLVLLSYPTHTSLCIWGADEALDPIDGTDYEIDYDARTIAAGMSAEDLIVQVTVHSVRASKPQLETFDLQASILAACVRRSENDDNRMYLIVAVRNEDGVYLRLGYFDTTGQQIVYWPIGGPIRLKSEPVSVCFELNGDEYFAIVGTLESTLQMFHVNSSTSTIRAFEYTLDGEFAVCDSLAVLTMQLSSNIEHLLVCGLRNGAVETLRIDLRSGTSVCFSWYFLSLFYSLASSTCQFATPVLRFAGVAKLNTPISINVSPRYMILNFQPPAFNLDISVIENLCLIFYVLTDASSVSLTSNADAELLSFCERLQIGSTTVTVATDNTRISRAIILCEQKLRCLEYPIDASAKAQVPASLNSIWLTDNGLSGFQQGRITAVTQASSGFAQGLLFCVERSQIHMARIAASSESRMVPRHIHVNGIPTRVLYSQRLKKLIVLYYQIGIIPAIQRNGNRITSNQRSFPNKIMIVDPDVECISLDSDESSDINKKSTSHDKPGERFLGVSEWFPNDGKDLHHMVVVHTELARPIADESKGRILIFSVERGILVHKTSYEESSPVYFLTPYGPDSLIYSCGIDLCLWRLDVRAGQSTGKMQQPIKHTLGAPGLYISTHEPLVYVTTDCNGLMVFRVEEDKFVEHWSESEEKFGLHHLRIPELSLTITSQQHCSITGLWESPNRSVDGSAPTVFQTTLSESITRFHQIRRPSWQKSLGIDSSSTTTSDPIIGTSTNGAIYQFEVLDEPSLSLLRFTQNMALRERLICPFGDAFKSGLRHLDPSLNRNDNLHVDGDIIRRLLDRGAEQTLRRMLERAPLPASRPGIESDFASPASRQKRFAELARAVGIVDWGNGEELMTAVIQWMRIRLQIAL